MAPRIVAAEIILIALLAVPFCALLRIRRGEPIGRVSLSTGLFLFVGGQLALGVAMVDHAWPITGYPMYATLPGPDIVTEDLQLSGTTVGGKAVEIPIESVYVDPNDLSDRALPLLRNPELRDRVARSFLDGYNATQDDGNAKIASLDVQVRIRHWEERTLLSERVEHLVTYGP